MQDFVHQPYEAGKAEAPTSASAARSSTEAFSVAEKSIVLV